MKFDISFPFQFLLYPADEHYNNNNNVDNEIHNNFNFYKTASFVSEQMAPNQ